MAATKQLTKHIMVSQETHQNAKVLAALLNIEINQAVALAVEKMLEETNRGAHSKSPNRKPAKRG